MVTEIVNVMAKIAVGMNKASTINEFIESPGKGKKYNKKIVATAYSWIYEKSIRDTNRAENISENNSIRIFSEEEIHMIGLGNYNYLFHLLNIKLLNTDDVSLIIDKLKFFPEDRIDSDLVNMLILSLFLDVDDFALPGSRLLLNSSDTIN